MLAASSMPLALLLWQSVLMILSFTATLGFVGVAAWLWLKSRQAPPTGPKFAMTANTPKPALIGDEPDRTEFFPAARDQPPEPRDEPVERTAFMVPFPAAPAEPEERTAFIAPPVEPIERTAFIAPPPQPEPEPDERTAFIPLAPQPEPEEHTALISLPSARPGG